STPKWYSAALLNFRGVTDWYQSTGYKELGRFQNLDYKHFSKTFKSLSPLPDIRARILPVSVGNLDYDLFVSSSLHNLTKDDSNESSTGTSLPKGGETVTTVKF
nr:hypothetical protein [Tanacetum cinerariifolium]